MTTDVTSGVSIEHPFPEHLLPAWDGTLILAGQRGSVPWNLHTKDSDRDWYGVWAHPVSHYLGLRASPDSRRSMRREDWQVKEGLDDLHVVCVRKFLQHISRNQAMFYLRLWIPIKHLYQVTKGGRYLLENRENMLSQKMIDGFWYSGCGLGDAGKIARATMMLTFANAMAENEKPELKRTIQYIIRQYKVGNTLPCTREYARLRELGKPSRQKRTYKDWDTTDFSRLSATIIQREEFADVVPAGSRTMYHPAYWFAD